MKLFKRNRGGEIPEEVQNYYQAERRERLWLAWLLAFSTLVVTVLIVIGLSFGGRWAYRKISRNDKKTDTTRPISSEQSKPLPGESKDNTTLQLQGSGQSQTSITQPTSPSPSTGPAPNQPAATTLSNTGPESDD